MGKMSRDKGKRGELEARDCVRRFWNSPECIRTAQVSGQFSSDLSYGPPHMHLEVKRYKSIAASKFMQQAQEDAPVYQIPVVMMREDNGEWLVMVRMEDSVEFARELIEHMDRS